MRESEIDPDHGRPDRWACRGKLDGRTMMRSGLRSEAAAIRAAWFCFDDICTRAHKPEIGSVEDLDNAVAEALARRFAVHREIDADGPFMRPAYSVALDSWAGMEASLLSQLLADAGSVRRLCKIIDVPRSTLNAWIRKHKNHGTWPV